MSFIDEFRKSPFLGIIRSLPPEQAASCAAACKSAGLKFAEVPLNTPSAASALKNLCEEGKRHGIAIGAGTVLTERDLQAAIGCGAQFIVTPGTNADVIRQCAQRGMPCIPGALTPTEIMQASALGADAVKVFPVSAMGGCQYIKELRGPFKNIPLLACGGVKAENAKDFFNAGCDFISFGASVFSVQDMESGNWQAIEGRIARLIS